GAEDGTRLRLRYRILDGIILLLELGQPEIEQLDSRVSDQDIAGLEIAVDDPLPMRGFKRLGALKGQPQGLLGLRRSAQRRSLAVLHHQVIGAEIVQCANVRMIERCEGARFALEALTMLLVQDLDGDGAAQARILCAIYLAHAPGAQEVENLVGAKA